MRSITSPVYRGDGGPSGMPCFTGNMTVKQTEVSRPRKRHARLWHRSSTRTQSWAFHGKHDGETPKGSVARFICQTSSMIDISPREIGFLLGILSGEGHFGGDGRQPHITLRMHSRREGLFRWLERAIPGSRLYGPYNHGGRSYFQWMVRGAVLREELAPLISRHRDLLDGPIAERFDAMCSTYGIGLADPGTP
jgi:hypothetical protein